jgi:hypothetical protein
MGAKNHGVVCPDANKTATLNALVGAGMFIGVWNAGAAEKKS